MVGEGVEGLGERDAQKKGGTSGWQKFFCFSLSKRKLSFRDVNGEAVGY